MTTSELLGRLSAYIEINKPTVSILETTQKKPHAQKFADREREASGKKKALKSSFSYTHFNKKVR